MEQQEETKKMTLQVLQGKKIICPKKEYDSILFCTTGDDGIHTFIGGEPERILYGLANQIKNHSPFGDMLAAAYELSQLETFKILLNSVKTEQKKDNQ